MAAAAEHNGSNHSSPRTSVDQGREGATGDGLTLLWCSKITKPHSQWNGEPV